MLLAAQPLAAASVEVKYNDLDLSTEQGRKELDRRINDAAKDVCGAGEESVGSRVQSRETRDCIKQAKRQIEQSLAKITGDEKAGG
jgi:UrcA family protein